MARALKCGLRKITRVVRDMRGNFGVCSHVFLQPQRWCYGLADGRKSPKRWLAQPCINPIGHNRAWYLRLHRCGIPRQIQPLAQLDLRDQQEDRHRGHAAPGF
jgi:hypothetical protein